MVSRSVSLAATSITIQLTATVFLAAQTPPIAAGFRPASNTTSVTSVQPPSGQVVSPETRGDIYMIRKMYREAVEIYQEGPQDSAVLLNKTGIAYHQMLDLVDARRFYMKAIKTDPRYAEAINNLGTIEYSRKSYRRAIGLYKRALRYSPNSASIYSNLGTGYFARKDYKSATAAFQRALELDPEVFEHRSNHGILLQERSVEERAKFHFYLAKMYAKNGSNDRALLYIRKALEEGFKERKKFEDPEFTNLRSLQEFKELLAMEPPHAL